MCKLIRTNLMPEWKQKPTQHNSSIAVWIYHHLAARVLVIMEKTRRAVGFVSSAALSIAARRVKSKVIAPAWRRCFFHFQFGNGDKAAKDARTGCCFRLTLTTYYQVIEPSLKPDSMTTTTHDATLASRLFLCVWRNISCIEFNPARMDSMLPVATKKRNLLSFTTNRASQTSEWYVNQDAYAGSSRELPQEMA